MAGCSEVVGGQNKRREASIPHVQKIPGHFRGFGRAPLHYGEADPIQPDGTLLDSVSVCQAQQ